MLDSITSKPIAPPGHERPLEIRVGRFGNWYRFTALVFLNGVLLFLLLNLILYVIGSVKPPTKAYDPIAKYGIENLMKAYPGWREEDVRTLVKETYGDLTFEYEPFTEFRNKPLRGRFLNVDPAGFRLTKDQAAWPPRSENFNVFMFGGSTTFGIGLPDNETIASYLQARAAANPSHQPLAVYNFARTYYFSSQERILFQQLLLAGYVPNVAVFVDGLNDFGFPDGQPRFADRFARMMSGKADYNPLENVPMFKAARWLTGSWKKPKLQKPASAPDDVPSAVLGGVVDRWLANKKVIEATAATFGVRPIFVWQPVPFYKYERRYHFLSEASSGDAYRPILNGYTLMDNLRAQGKLGPNVLWLADMQQDKHDNLYVDVVHYNAAFSQEIAGRIYGFLN